MKPEHRRVIESLSDGNLYAPAQIADIAENLGIWDGLPAEDVIKRRRYFRQNLGRKTRQCPEIFSDPDGRVEYPGQGALDAWYGYRWKKAAGLVEE